MMSNSPQPGLDMDGDAIDRYFDSEPRTERRHIDRRIAERRDAESHPTGYWQEEAKRNFDVAAKANDLPSMVQWGAILHCCNGLRDLQEQHEVQIAEFKAEVAALKAIIG